MTEFEEALHEAIKHNRLKGFTLWPCQSGWQGNARWNDSLGWSVYVDADPIVALTKALRSQTNFDPAAAPVKEPPKAAGGIFD